MLHNINFKLLKSIDFNVLLFGNNQHHSATSSSTPPHNWLFPIDHIPFNCIPPYLPSFLLTFKVVELLKTNQSPLHVNHIEMYWTVVMSFIKPRNARCITAEPSRES